MNRLPDIEMPMEITNNEIKSIDNLEEDLKIIGEGEILTEDLKSDPFIRPGPFIKAVPIIPAQPPLVKQSNPSGKEIRKKKVTSDKQKAHLSNARRLAKEKKEEKDRLKKELLAPPPPAQVVPVANDEDEYMKWLDKMDKYKKMTALLQKQEEEKAAILLKKEKELEAKYFKRFKQLQQVQETPAPAPVMPTILENKETFGQFSGYF